MDFRLMIRINNDDEHAAANITRVLRDIAYDIEQTGLIPSETKVGIDRKGKACAIIDEMSYDDSPGQ